MGRTRKRKPKSDGAQALTIGDSPPTARELAAFGRLNAALDRELKLEALISSARCSSGTLATRDAVDRSTLRDLRRVTARISRKCSIERRRLEDSEPPKKAPSPSIVRFAMGHPLRAYERLERYIPRVVNIVAVASASPIPGSGCTLPLSDEMFQAIATKCTGTYSAPRRFSNILLGYHEPRARVLIFQTGQIVTTGTTAISSTRLIVNIVLEQLAREAGIYLYVQKFAVKNMVASCSLDATFNCVGFSEKNSAETNYDRSTFAGMVSPLPTPHSHLPTPTSPLPPPTSPLPTPTPLSPAHTAHPPPPCPPTPPTPHRRGVPANFIRGAWKSTRRVKRTSPAPSHTMIYSRDLES